MHDLESGVWDLDSRRAETRMRRHTCSFENAFEQFKRVCEFRVYNSGFIRVEGSGFLVQDSGVSGLWFGIQSSCSETRGR